MLNINFVPDDYVQSSESKRTNILYLVLFVIVMVSLAGVFASIKVRQHSIEQKEKMINQKMAEAEQAIKQYEALQAQRKEMIKTALTTAELIEPVPRSVLLAYMTNNLPTGVSFLKIELIQKEPAHTVRRRRATTQYQQAKQGSDDTNQQPISREKLMETYIDIEGLAPSDLEVASYIEHLSSSAMLENVELVESKEHKIEEVMFRRFKLTAILAKEATLTEDDIQQIKTNNAFVSRIPANQAEVIIGSELDENQSDQ